jgi:CDP-glucose 4,6-dehydratase
MQLTVSELVERILGLMGSDLVPEVRGEATHEIPAQFLDASKARSVLGWTPLFSLDEGLERTITWYREALGAAA